MPMRRGAILLTAVLLAGCVRTVPEPEGPEQWVALARRRHLAGESAAEFSRLQAEAGRENRKQGLPDLARLVRGPISPERRAEIVTDTLRECVAIASVRLVDRGDTVTAVARKIHGSELDFRSAMLLAEKEFLDSVVWKTPAQTARDRELRQEMLDRFGAVPPPGKAEFPPPSPPGTATESPVPVVRVYGKDPAALLRFGAFILSLPGEFARQYIADPDYKPEGIWLEARRIAALAALAAAEREYARAYADWRREPSPENLFRCRKWRLRQVRESSAVPLLRGNASDLQALQALMELQEPF